MEKKQLFGKKSHSAETTERGTLWDFPSSILTQNSKKMKGEPLGENIFLEKVAVPEKTERGDPLVSPCMVCYTEKQEKPFWFTSLGQMVQFGAIRFNRTFNYFGQFVWIEKSHYISRVSLHEAPTRKKNKKSTGYDGISNEILKCCSPIIEPYVADVFNKCLEQSIFQEPLKIARVFRSLKKETEVPLRVTDQSVC